MKGRGSEGNFKNILPQVNAKYVISTILSNIMYMKIQLHVFLLVFFTNGHINYGKELSIFTVQ